MRFSPFDAPTGSGALAITRTLELCHGHGLVELRHGTEHLPDQGGRRRVVDEGVRTVDRDQGDAEFAQAGMPDLLDHQITREAVCGLDQDDAHAIASDALHHRREAGSRLQGVGTRNGGVVEGIDNLVAIALGEALDGFSLALVESLSAPTLAADEVRK